MLDLAAEWRAFSGHPFVFAFWAVRRGSRLGRDRGDLLRRSYDAGLASFAEWCGEEAAASGLSEAGRRGLSAPRAPLRARRRRPRGAAPVLPSRRRRRADPRGPAARFHAAAVTSRGRGGPGRALARRACRAVAAVLVALGRAARLRSASGAVSRPDEVLHLKIASGAAVAEVYRQLARQRASAALRASPALLEGPGAFGLDAASSARLLRVALLGRRGPGRGASSARMPRCSRSPSWRCCLRWCCVSAELRGYALLLCCVAAALAAWRGRSTKSPRPRCSASPSSAPGAAQPLRGVPLRRRGLRLLRHGESPRGGVPERLVAAWAGAFAAARGDSPRFSPRTHVSRSARRRRSRRRSARRGSPRTTTGGETGPAAFVGRQTISLFHYLFSSTAAGGDRARSLSGGRGAPRAAAPPVERCCSPLPLAARRGGRSARGLPVRRHAPLDRSRPLRRRGSRRGPVAA